MRQFYIASLATLWVYLITSCGSAPSRPAPPPEEDSVVELASVTEVELAHTSYIEEEIHACRGAEDCGEGEVCAWVDDHCGLERSERVCMYPSAGASHPASVCGCDGRSYETPSAALSAAGGVAYESTCRRYAPDDLPSLPPIHSLDDYLGPTPYGFQVHHELNPGVQIQHALVVNDSGGTINVDYLEGWVDGCAPVGGTDSHHVRVDCRRRGQAAPTYVRFYDDQYCPRDTPPPICEMLPGRAMYTDRHGTNCWCIAYYNPQGHTDDPNVLDRLRRFYHRPRLFEVAATLVSPALPVIWSSLDEAYQESDSAREFLDDFCGEQGCGVGVGSDGADHVSVYVRTQDRTVWIPVRMPSEDVCRQASCAEAVLPLDLEGLGSDPERSSERADPEGETPPGVGLTEEALRLRSVTEAFAYVDANRAPSRDSYGRLSEGTYRRRPNPGQPTDCSGLVSMAIYRATSERVWLNEGLENGVRNIMRRTRSLPGVTSARPGDLLVFDNRSHIAIVTQIHRSQSGEVVGLRIVHSTNSLGATTGEVVPATGGRWVIRGWPESGELDEDGARAWFDIAPSR